MRDGNSQGGGPRVDAVEDLYTDYLGLVNELQSRSPSDLAALNRSYNKHLLVAAASSLESLVKRHISEIFRGHGREELRIFVHNRVLARNYHTLFAWDDKKAKSLFRSFGPECAGRFSELLKNDSAFKCQHDSFMELGFLRNRLVHADYASHPVDLTPDEIMVKYRQAIAFVVLFERIILPIASDEGGSSSTLPT